MARKASWWAALAGACCCAAAWAGDWPCWGGGAGRNMVSPQRSLPETFQPGLGGEGGAIDVAALRGVKWIASLGGQTYSSPVVAGGRVYIGTGDRGEPEGRPGGGALLCLDERTGRLLWRLRVPRARSPLDGNGFDDLGAGICSTPAVEDGRAYLVTNRGEVLCLDANGLADGNDGPFDDEALCLATDANSAAPPRPGDADILWRFDMVRRLPCVPHDAAASSVLLDGNVLYVGTGNGVHRWPSLPVPMPDAPSLIALDKRTGRLLAVDAERIGRRTFHGQWSSPSLGQVGGRRLVFYGGGDGMCYAFDAIRSSRDEGDAGDGQKGTGRVATLKKVWQFDCNGPELRRPGGQDANYWAGDASRAGPCPDYVGPSEIVATPVFRDGRLYVAVGRDPLHGPARGALHCIDAAGRGDITDTGCLWSCRSIARSLSTVAVAGGLVYAADVAGDIRCLDAADGRCLWVCRTKQEIWASPLVADGKLYVGTQQRHVWVLRAGRTLNILATIRLDRPVSSAPAAANGTLYLASHRRLWAVTGR